MLYNNLNMSFEVPTSAADVAEIRPVNPGLVLIAAEACHDVIWTQDWRDRKGDLPRWKIEVQKSDGSKDWLNPDDPLPAGALHTGQKVDLAHTKFKNLPEYWQNENIKNARRALQLARSWLVFNPGKPVDGKVMRFMAADLHKFFVDRRTEDEEPIPTFQAVSFDDLALTDSSGQIVQGGQNSDYMYIRYAFYALAPDLRMRVAGKMGMAVRRVGGAMLAQGITDLVGNPIGVLKLKPKYPELFALS